MMRVRISWLLSAALLLGTTAATAQSLPCSSVSPEVRDYVRKRGACRDAKPAPRPRASTRPKASVSDSPASAPRKLLVPDVNGRSYADAARALANFKVERIEATSAAPTGAVLSQDPAPATLAVPGSTVLLQVSDGSLAAASTNPVTTPVTAAVASSTAAPAANPAPALTAAPIASQEPAVSPETRGQFPTALSASVALIFGAGVLLGLLSGALLTRARLLRRQVAVGEHAPPPTLPQRHQQLDQQPAESDSGGVSEPGAPSEIRFAARFVPVETTIVLTPFPGADEASIDSSSNHHA